MQGPSHIYVAHLEPGLSLSGDYLILDVIRAQTSRGSNYLSFNLADRTGKISAKAWDLTAELEETLKNGLVVRVNGQVEAYRGQPQAVIRGAENRPQSEVDWREFLMAAARPPQDMRADLETLVATVADDDYRRMLETILAHPQITDYFNTAPAAKAFHHAYLSGLLEHTLSVTQLADLICGHYPQLNRSLLIAGAVLHDLGKIWEFTPAPQIEMTTPGRMLGHLVMGLSFLEEIISNAPDFPGEKAILLKHLLISHHGEYNFGSPKKPKILEGLALHLLDDLDAKINGLGGFIERHADAKTGWTDYNRLMGQYFFDPARGFPALAPAEAGACRATRPPKKKSAKATVLEPGGEAISLPDDQNLLF